MFARKIILVLLACVAAPVSAKPDIQHWQTTKGTEVYFVETHELPMVDIQLIFDAGSGRDADKPGLALLTNGLLSEGAGGLSANEISSEFENLGAKFGNNAGNDSGSVSLRSITVGDTLQRALVNFKRVITQPDFPQSAFERERSRLLTAIKQKQQSPASLASDAFYKAIYGDHPYAQPTEGTEASLATITTKNIAAFYQKYYVASNAVVAIVGDLDRNKAQQMVEELLSDIPQGEKAPALPEVLPLAGADSIHIDHPSTQTHVLVGQPGIRRDDPDLFPLYVGNTILGGGGMVSRLFEEIREKRGLSYSVYSYFLPMKQAGPFVAGLQTRADQVDDALNLTMEQIRQYIETGPTRKELDDAKKNITGGFPLRIDSNSDISAYLGMIAFYGLPLDYLETYNKKVMSVTAQQVKDAFQRKLSPDKMVTVTVGPEPEQTGAKN